MESRPHCDVECKRDQDRRRENEWVRDTGGVVIIFASNNREYEDESPESEQDNTYESKSSAIEAAQKYMAGEATDSYWEKLMSPLPIITAVHETYSGNWSYSIVPAAMGTPPLAGKVGKVKFFSTYLFRKGGFLNSNRYLRIGFARKGGRRVFRIAGEVIKIFKKNGKIDIKDLGPL